MKAANSLAMRLEVWTPAPHQAGIHVDYLVCSCRDMQGQGE